MTTNQIHVYVRKLTNASLKKRQKESFLLTMENAT